MAEPDFDAAEALRANVSLVLKYGGSFLFKISTDNVEALKIVSSTALRLGALYVGYNLVRPLIDAAVKKAFGGERTDQEVQEINAGSLLVRLRCFTDERFLEVLEDYESGRMKERLQEEFSQVEIKVQGLKVEIDNMAEVNETKEAINKRNPDKRVEKPVKDDVQHDKKHLSLAIMKPLPCDQKALWKEAIALGLLGSNPSLEKPRAKLLACIHSSLEIRRSINHVSFLLVGTTGVGKSATVNHLLGVDLARTSETESETRTTREFIIDGSDPKYEVKGLSLGLVDTPGFCDTDGSKQDACNLLSVQRFFRTHRKLSKSYPNLVFLLVKATDNRIKGENSELGKSLRCVKRLGLADPHKPNVVVILTHVCSIRKRNEKEWTEALEKIKTNITKIVFDDLKVYAPIVLIENEYDDSVLEHLGDYTVLPNKELQAKNLYDACASVLTDNNDELALITLNSIFVESKNNKNRRPKAGYELPAKDAKRSRLDKDESVMVELFQQAMKGGFEDPFYSAILQYIDDQELETKEKEELMKIARILENLGEGDPPSFGSHSIHTIEFYHGKEISPTGRKMLQEKFKIAMNPPSQISESGRLIGQGYNIFTDKAVAAQVMNLDQVSTRCGIAIPVCAKFEKVTQCRSFMEVFEDEESYAQSRLKSLNVNLTVRPDIFKMDYRAGYNKNVTTSSSTSEYSFLFEQRLFELKLANYKEHLNRSMTFTEDFKSEVAKLPQKYNKNDPSCVSRFERFFNRFGHFLVSSAYGGGSVEVKCSRKSVESTEMSLADAKAFLAATLEGWKEEQEDLSAGTVKTTALLKQSALSWNGGEAALQTNETISDKKMLQKWKDSLPQNPTMLTSELTLEPISTAVGCVDPQKDQATYDALKDVLGSEFKIPVKKQKKSPSTTNATTRKETVREPDQSDENCFPATSVVNVQSKDGEIKHTKMANLGVGDKVMAWDTKHNRIVFTKVIMFAHLAPDAMGVEYLKITLEDGNQITLSGNHLVMTGKHKKAILARKIKPGDILFSVDENREISPKKVLAVEKVIEQGIYCPITCCGNVIVDNVLASCYASVQDHVLLKGLVKISAQSMAHLGLMPMRALHKLRSKWLRKIPNDETIHPYLQWLCKLNHPCMVNSNA